MNLFFRKIAWLMLAAFACHADGGDGTITTESAGSEASQASSSPLAAPSGTPPQAADGSLPSSSPAAAPSSKSETPYYGSAELNPNQRPLRIDTTGKSKEEIDEILSMADGDIFKSDEEIAAAAAKNPASKVAPESKQKADPAKTSDADASAAPASPEAATKEFYEKTGLDHETFTKLPESVQEKLVELAAGDGSAEVTQKLTKLESEHQTFKKDTEVVFNDPVISARLEELQTGKALVARNIPPISDADLDKIDDLLTKDKKVEARQLINKHIADRAAEAVANERTVADRKVAEKQMRSDVYKVFKEIGDLDPRFKLEEKDGEAITPGHKEWSKFDNGGVFAELKEFARKRGLGMQAITAAGAKEIYAMYAASKGWDKQKETKLVEFGKKELLKALRNPTVASRTLPPGKADGMPGAPNAGLGFDRQTLIDALVKGNGSTPEYQRLLAANDGNDKAMDQILGCYHEAQRVIQSRRTA